MEGDIIVCLGNKNNKSKLFKSMEEFLKIEK